MDRSVTERQHAVKAPAPPARTPAGDALTDLIGQVVQLIRRFSVAGEALAKPAGQTLARWLLLESIDAAPATVAQIARTMHVARQSVQRLADVLVRDGFAVYQDNPAHRRAKLLAITPRGRAALRTIQAAQVAWSDRMGAELGEAELRRASAVLDRVLQALQDPAFFPEP
ncbi:MAG TPA: MarR family transcriptional regulator [Actinomycetes bacterium]